MHDGGNFFVTLVVILMILGVVFMLLREFFCWYWKINERVAILYDIKKILQNQGQTQSRSVSAPSSVPEKLQDMDHGNIIILGGKKYLHIDEGQGNAFCCVCRSTAPLVGMFKLENSDYYYHRECLEKSM